MQEIRDQDDQARWKFQSWHIPNQVQHDAKKLQCWWATQLDWRVPRQQEAIEPFDVQIRCTRPQNWPHYRNIPARSDNDTRGPSQRSWNSHQQRSSRKLRHSLMLYRSWRFIEQIPHVYLPGARWWSSLYDHALPGQSLITAQYARKGKLRWAFDETDQCYGAQARPEQRIG